MKRNIFILSLLSCLLLTAVSCGKKYSYETVAGDPLNARIYTLDNGLKVYLTVNKETPRIQTLIPVRVGGKNDPAETTGLSHYLEHIMFKGTTHFGTQNYEAEKPLLDQITDLYEVYRKTTDEAERKAIYHQIDSISYEASKISIPNEYDKLMAAIGAEGTNAYTSYDVTCYTEDIPSNQIENWAKVESDRFKNMVIRGFHTELEAVYEEKNISMGDDQEKVIDSLAAGLFRNHPYGKQSVIGTQDHLKNPSIVNIMNHYNNWYVPNNMAICMSGDFDPDKVIRVIDKYFGDMEPNEHIVRPVFDPEQPITEPIVKTVVGQEAENTWLGWRMPAAASAEAPLAELIGELLYNGQAGLLDLDLVQQQKVLVAQCFPYQLSDYCAFLMIGYPKEGQTLEEVRDLLLGEVAKLRNGEFDESLLHAIAANKKLEQQRGLERNRSRASMFVDAFVNGQEWKDAVSYYDRMAAFTKDDVVRFAQQYMGADAYTVVYKRQGVDTDRKTIEKPAITPIFTNRDTVSAFLAEVQNSTVAPIEPAFVDFGKELTKGTVNDMPALYKKNDINDIFNVQYVWEFGDFADPLLATAAGYANYLGTSKKTAAQVKQELYNIACSMDFRVGDKRTTLSVSGLQEYMSQALALVEDFVADMQPDEAVLEGYKADIIRSRMVNKTNQRANFNALRQYVLYGPGSPATRTLSNAEVMALGGQQLTDKVKALADMKHRVVYYGPASSSEAFTLIAENHRTGTQDVPVNEPAPYQPTDENVVYLAPFVANNSYVFSVTNLGTPFDLAKHPSVELYNEYFGSGMNGIVFQEMREARGLAYSASARDVEPTDTKETEYFMDYIITQNDKVLDALTHFDEIINQMPVSEAAFTIAKEGLLANMRTMRVTGQAVLRNWQSLQDLGLDTDMRRDVYEKVQTMTLDDVVAYQQGTIKGRNYHICVLGDPAQLDLEGLARWGRIEQLTTEQIFGF
ncbi:MAG: insulinase family protein [Bacteroidaceae bacterium]|nr:insulinase family protein [Bacteroidaceae bacterium]